jgi:hypothetical protein
MSVKEKSSVREQLEQESLKRAVQEDPIKKVRTALMLSNFCLKLRQICSHVRARPRAIKDKVSFELNP